jgi:AraC-like DNA-binding protein
MSQSTPLIFIELAKQLGTKVVNGRVDIPESYGKGYCSGCVFNEKIRILIFNYELKQDLILDNPEINTTGKMILFKFQNIFKTQLSKENPSVLIATSRINSDEIISIQNATSINIEVDSKYLEELFGLSKKSPILQSLSKNSQPLLFEQLIFPSLQIILDEIISESVEDSFKWILRKIKAEELICRLLIELEKRQEQQLYPLNGKDIQTLYALKEEILNHLATPPVINDLAEQVNMSPTKLKNLFKQIFGDSIFSYYQGFRMKEAARLLKEEQLSVSDVGYCLGFSNLSHFSRVFEENIGMKPKKYSKS